MRLRYTEHRWAGDTSRRWPLGDTRPAALALLMTVVLSGTAVQAMIEAPASDPPPFPLSGKRPALHEPPDFPAPAGWDWHAPPAPLQWRFAAIEGELADRGVPSWAGIYHLASPVEGIGLHIALAPHHGMAAVYGNCVAYTWANEGSIAMQADGSLRLRMQWGAPNVRPAPLGERLVPVQWGERHYLVAADRLREFLRDFASDATPKSDDAAPDEWEALLLRGDESRPGGRLVVPPAYLALLQSPRTPSPRP